MDERRHRLDIDSIDRERLGSLARSIHKDSSSRHELKKEIELDDITRDDGKSELLRLEEQGAVLQRLEPLMPRIALQSAQHAREQGSPPQNLGIGCENAVRGHGFDLLADDSDHRTCSFILGIERTSRMHEFLDGDRRMIDLPRVDQTLNDQRRVALHLVDIDAGIEQQRLADQFLFAGEGEFAVRPPRKRPTRIEPGPAQRARNIKCHHVRNPASDPGPLCPEQP